MDIEQRLDAAADGGDTKDVLRVGHAAEVRRRLDLVRGETDDFLDGVNDCTHENVAARAARHLNDYNAGALTIGNSGHFKLGPQVQDGDHSAAQIDNALDVMRHLWHGRNRAKPDDFPDIEHRNTVGTGPQNEREVPASTRSHRDIRCGNVGH